MIDAKKLQCYTMAHRLRGFASGLEEGRQNEVKGSLPEDFARLIQTQLTK